MATLDRPLRRLGVLGGTFDPIHRGHLAVAREAIGRFDLDRMMFVPAGQPWQKSFFSDPEDRFFMTTVATADDPGFVVSRVEIDRKGPTYTGHTLVTLRTFFGPDVDLFFVAGADAVLNLGTWKTLDMVAELCEVIAVTRPAFDLAGVDPDPSWPRIHIMEIAGIDISASDIRARVARGQSIAELVPPDVLAYIRARGLYQTAMDEKP